MRSYSKNLFKVKLPKGFELQESVGENGKAQTSLSFPLALIWKKSGLEFGVRFNDVVSQVEK